MLFSEKSLDNILGVVEVLYQAVKEHFLGLVCFALHVL